MEREKTTVGHRRSKESKMKYLLQHLKQIQSFTSGKQREFYDWEVSNAQHVKIHSVKEDSELELIVDNFLKGFQPQTGQCYMTAWKLVMDKPNLFEYIEGQISVLGIPIDHAWCYYKPKKLHIDILEEFVLRKMYSKDSRKNKYSEYLMLAKYSHKTILKYADQSGFYGPYLTQAFTDKLKTNK